MVVMIQMDYTALIAWLPALNREQRNNLSSKVKLNRVYSICVYVKTKKFNLNSTRLRELSIKTTCYTHWDLEERIT